MLRIGIQLRKHFLISEVGIFQKMQQVLEFLHPVLHPEMVLLLAFHILEEVHKPNWVGNPTNLITLQYVQLLDTVEIIKNVY